MHLQNQCSRCVDISLHSPIYFCSHAREKGYKKRLPEDIEQSFSIYRYVVITY